jgi:hypothetical protein
MRRLALFWRHADVLETAVDVVELFFSFGCVDHSLTDSFTHSLTHSLTSHIFQVPASRRMLQTLHHE